jgi:hypothetical protein
MLGTGDVAIIYYISSTKAHGWLAGESGTASKPRRQQAGHQQSQRLGGEAGVRETGIADGCTPSSNY